MLFEGRAIPLGASPLVVGRSPGTAAAIISLPEGLAGVSRRHCTFVRNGDELVLVDHSHYGTFVNGERVSERVRIHAGDKVRVGEPGHRAVAHHDRCLNVPRRRRSVEIFSLSFLDCICCGFGAVILFCIDHQCPEQHRTHA